MSEKYPRIPHFPFSPGVSRDDKVNYGYWDKIKEESVVLTEKLDGENTCLNRYGVYARSHSAPTRNPWADYLKPMWAMIKNGLGNLEIFGENLYGIHSIEYTNLQNYFYVFAVRELDKWLSWEEVNDFAQHYDFPTVPVESNVIPATIGERLFKTMIEEYAIKPSSLGGEREGLVVRVEREFKNEEFRNCVLKWVRSNHVKSDEHWTKNWKRAKLTNSF